MANEERIELWATALESEEYAGKQGTGYLQYYDTYCCLGVACRVAIKNGLEVANWTDDGHIFKFGGQQGYLPYEVREWYGLDQGDPNLYYDDDEQGFITCTTANDEVHLDFREIAAHVRERYITKNKEENG